MVVNLSTVPRSWQKQVAADITLSSLVTVAGLSGGQGGDVLGSLQEDSVWSDPSVLVPAALCLTALVLLGALTCCLMTGQIPS